MNEDSKKDNESENKLCFWICQKNPKVTDCSEIKNKAYSEKINLVKSKKLCFNCLSNTHTISNSNQKTRAELKVAKRDIIHF